MMSQPVSKKISHALLRSSLHKLPAVGSLCKITYQITTVRRIWPWVGPTAAKAFAAGKTAFVWTAAAAKSTAAVGAVKASAAAKSAAAAAIPFAKSTAAAAIPLAKSTAKGAVGTTAFYIFWRGCEKAEESVHDRAGGRADFFMTKAQLQQVTRARAAASETPPPATPPKPGQDTFIPSPLDDYFLNLPNSNGFTVAFILFAAALFLIALFIRYKVNNAFLKETAEAFIKGGLLATLSWLLTAGIFHYVKNLNLDIEDVLTMLQDASNISIIKFFVGILIGIILFFANKKFIIWYEIRKQK